MFGQIVNQVLRMAWTFVLAFLGKMIYNSGELHDLSPVLPYTCIRLEKENHGFEDMAKV